MKTGKRTKERKSYRRYDEVHEALQRSGLVKGFPATDQVVRATRVVHL